MPQLKCICGTPVTDAELITHSARSVKTRENTLSIYRCPDCERYWVKSREV